MANLPKDPSFDSAFSFVRDGYSFIQNKSLKNKTNVLETKLMFMPVILLTGEEGAKLFYDETKFIRNKAVPTRVQKTLLGKDGVQTLDDQVHKHRKAMFMSVMTEQNILRIADITKRWWNYYISEWQRKYKFELFYETQELLCRVACEWAGIPLHAADARERADDFVAMIDAFGAVGPRHWRGKLARSRTEAWITKLIAEVRQGNFKAEDGTALSIVAKHQNLDGSLLDLHTATVELINLTRPIVAISYYITFSAHALHTYPESKLFLKKGEDVKKFVNEVRRFYPFAPFMGARVRKEFEWKGMTFPESRLVFLDVYGINHDARIWDSPEKFKPERFNNKNITPFDFIPQGGGDHYKGHRCAGEWVTMEVMNVILSEFGNLDYLVDEQNLSFSLRRMPTFPKSGFVITRLRRSKFANETKESFKNKDHKEENQQSKSINSILTTEKLPY